MKDFPVIKFTIAYIIGILILPVIQLQLFVPIILILILILLVVLSKYNQFINGLKLLSSIIALLIIITLGNFCAQLNRQELNSEVTSLYKENNVNISGIVSEIELIRKNEIVFQLKANRFNYDDRIIKDKIELLCRLRGSQKEREKFYDEIRPGYYVDVNGTYRKGNEKRNPGEFDYNAYLHSEGIVGIVAISELGDIKILKSTPDFFKNLIFQSRKYIDKQLQVLYDEDTAGLLRGLLLADRSEIDYSIKTQFINSGVIHVLAVSGLHVGFIAAIFFILFGRFNIYFRSIATIIGLLAFMFLTGIPPSVFRATVMGIVIILAFLTNRSTNIFNSLTIAALIILVIIPGEIYSPGFQLSFSAVLAIAVIFPLINNFILASRLKSKFLKYIILFVGVSLAAQLGTLPFTLIYFGKVSVIALFTNLLVIPVIGLIISLAVTTLIFNLFASGIAVYFSLTNMLVSNFILDVIRFTGNLSFSHIKLPQYSVYDAIIFYVFLSVMIYSVRRFKSKKAVIILILFIATNIFLYTSLDDKSLLPDNELSIMAIDVGQGDAILIKFPNEQTALIDAGSATYYFDNGERVILPLLDYLGVDKIDYGFVSHIDLDHYGGFVSLIHNGKIKQLFKPEIDSSLKKDVRFEKFIRKNNIKLTYYNHQSFSIGNVRIYILNNKFEAGVYNLSSNNNSGVIKIVYGNSSFLFTGDAEVKAEKIMINDYQNFLDVDVLKAGHHGSKTSSSENFIKFTSPRYAIISAGIQNKFGHPDLEIINRFKMNKVNVYRTDKSGALLFESDGQDIKRINWKN